MRTFFLFFISIILVSCNHFEFSPNQTFDSVSLKDINANNLKRLGTGVNDDTVKFILTGDSQRSRDETVKLCKAANAIDGIDFVVLNGDITEFGVLKEMLWISRTLEDLTMPYIAVIGNHDETGRGKESFRNMFGELNYSFVYGGIKFICHDSNSREYNFNGQVPNMPWMKAQLQPSPDVTGCIAVSHIPVNSIDFDSKLKDDYINSFAQTPGFLASLNAHTHNFEVFYPDNSGIPYIVTSSMDKREFLVIQIVNNKLSFERVPF
ncbi:metallophosphoesterase family protein [Pedobacter hiemivivus]|uniref:Metallophosphoesterase n=1 Tax=Pedobacter hiemivivus TaxID=2530454 RepID=A0A4R0N9L1_9SPHI|nr:metallophosphoesterase [Pedobacter hiemivivus]TCC96899.1 metallophosphoesterase [Pedobacter hiemivivus]